MRPWAAAAGGAGFIAAVLFQGELAGQPVQLDTLLDRATRYVGEFVYAFPTWSPRSATSRRRSRTG